MKHLNLMTLGMTLAVTAACQSKAPPAEKTVGAASVTKSTSTTTTAEGAATVTTPAEVVPLTKIQMEAFQRGVGAYRMKSEHLLALLKTEAPPKAILEQSDSLTVLGIQLVGTLKSQLPGCGGYFDALKKASSSLSDLSLEAIERDYHDGAALPKNSDPVCYHGKDLVVHPATVSVLAKAGLSTKDARQKAQGELTEVLTHLDQVKTSIK
ncbi:MAG: hypothetical protein VX589_13880 [Myxococcota bacterium]|nr:hypothetical protein [Myxococcota bacterium]